MKGLSLEDFMQKARSIHREKFNYSLSVYKNVRTKLQIQCNECNIVFQQLPRAHLEGGGCLKCGNQNRRSNTSEFITKANRIHHNRYNYSLVEYTLSKHSVTIQCNNCKTPFRQTPANHLQGEGCPVCNTGSSNTDDFILKASNIHNEKYDYSSVNYVGCDI